MLTKFMSAVAFSCLAAGVAQAKILPDNNLYLQDNMKFTSNVTEEEFNAVIAKATEIFTPIVREHGGTLSIRGNWNDSTVNASAMQIFTFWQVNMYGGLARRPEVTLDGFTLVLCHEIGHHLAGFPFVSNWAANEGQSDYWATEHCAPLFWKDDREGNARARLEVPEIAKQWCDDVWGTEDEQNLCYRKMLGGKSLADLLGALKSQTVDFATPDENEVDAINNSHPAAQCRLDTYSAGALCPAGYDASVIPGKRSGRGRNDQQAEEESARYSCTAAGQYTAGLRPRCWFKPTL